MTADGNSEREVSLTDEQRKAQPLLERYGVILCPGDIDGDAYRELAWALAMGRELHPDRALELRIKGWGGGAPDAFAIVDMIMVDEVGIDGVLIGAAHSAHSLLFAACRRRYVYPLARLGIHSVAYTGGLYGRVDTDRIEVERRQLRFDDEDALALYVAASNKPRRWWKKRFYRGREGTFVFRADELVQIGMARPISERAK